MQPPEYTIAHIREALARDERTNVLDVRLRIDSGKLYLLGQVDSEERRATIEEVVRENLPESLEVANELTVADYAGPESEEIP